MKFLLDTHAFVWSILEPQKIPVKTRRLLENAQSNVYFSSLNLWEISLKFSLGKLRLKTGSPEDLLRAAKQQDFNFITLSEQDALGFANVPRHIHSDPFDRMLIWQAVSRGLTLVSAEAQLSEYQALGLKWVW